MGLMNYQMDIVLREYERTRLNNNHLKTLRHEEVCSRIPQYKKLEKKLASLAFEAAQLSLRGDDSAQKNLQKQTTQIIKQKRKLLQEAGYPISYLETIFHCRDCEDTGYINNEKCHCFKKAIVDLLYDQSNLKSQLKQHTFENFRLDYYPDDYIEETTGLTPLDNIKNVLSVCKDFVTYFKKGSGNLLFYGNTGVGKTFLSHCIAKELIEEGNTVIYLTSLELFDILEKCKFDKSTNDSKNYVSYSYIMQCDLLIIDDLGTELNNSFISSQLYGCIDSRLLSNKSTIISTNLSFDDLSSHYSERIFSRLTSQYTLLKIIGDDIRLKKAIKNK